MKNYMVIFFIFLHTSLLTQVLNFSTKFDLPEEVSETSGLLFFNNKIITHNDSGGGAKLYEIDPTSGLITRTITINNATNVDWEDIAADDTHIFIGDIGNNNGTRNDLKIYKILKTDYLNNNNVSAEIITYSYQDQSDFTSLPNNNNFDAEAMSIYNGNIIIFTKNWADLKVNAYVLPNTSGHQTAVKTSTYNVNGLITGSSYNEEDDSFMLSGYNNIDGTPFLLYIDRNRTTGNDVFNGVPKKTILTSELGPGNQVESIIHLNNLDYYISREKVNTTVSGVPITITQRMFEFSYIPSTIWEGDDGTSPTDWSVSENWSNGVPTLSSNVTIPNTANTPVIANSNNAFTNNIIINANASITISAGGNMTINGNLTQNGSLNIISDVSTNGSLIAKGTSIGNITYKRYLTGTNWHLIGAPLNGQNINGFSDLFLQNESGLKAIANYRNNVISESRWNYYSTDGSNPIISAGNFLDAKGYSTKIKTAGTLNFSGSLNTDDKTILLTDGGDEPNGNRWNLIANPFTASLKGGSSTNNNNSFLKVNIDASNLDPSRAGLFLWNGTTYVERSLDDDTFIAPGQAFFVHAPDGGGTSVDFTETMQTHQTGNVFLKSNSSYPEIIIKVTDGSSNSITKVRYIQNKTTGLDIGSDIGTFTGSENSFKLFTHLVSNSQGEDFAIQALPNSGYENMEVPIGLYTETAKEIIFSADISNFNPNLKVFIEDREKNTFTRIDEITTNYKIILDNAQVGIGRFYLHTTSNSLSLNEHEKFNNISIYNLAPSTIRILGLPEGNCNIKLYNIQGKEVFKKFFTSEKEVKDLYLSNLTAGIYILEIRSERDIVSKKIILE